MVMRARGANAVPEPMWHKPKMTAKLELPSAGTMREYQPSKKLKLPLVGTWGSYRELETRRATMRAARAAAGSFVKSFMREQMTTRRDKFNCLPADAERRQNECLKGKNCAKARKQGGRQAAAELA